MKWRPTNQRKKEQTQISTATTYFTGNKELVQNQTEQNTIRKQVIYIKRTNAIFDINVDMYVICWNMIDDR